MSWHAGPGKTTPLAANNRKPLGSVFRLEQGFAALFGFFLQFNILVGGGSDDASIVGGFGFRMLDFLSVVAVGILLIYALRPRRVFPLAAFAAVVGAMVLLRVLEPRFWSDPRTLVLGLHYLDYSFAALYLAMICSEEVMARAFCWGLIAGLVATVPIFVFQELGYSDTLAQFGLVPGYHLDGDIGEGDILRYSGLWGHPNEAGHIAALAGAAGAYFAYHRRLFPAAITAVALVVVFYYTRSRAGLFAGGAVLALALLMGGKKRINFLRLAVLVTTMTAAIGVLSQLDFISDRFENDPTAANNLSERLASTLAGIKLALANPFGLPLDVYYSEIQSATGGVGSPHNGFIALAIILGMMPLIVFAVSLFINFRNRNGSGLFFFFLATQVSISFMFEQLPTEYDYAFMICLLFGRAFLLTRVGSELRFGKGFVPLPSRPPLYGTQLVRQSPYPRKS
jgi:hypothetical protein